MRIKRILADIFRDPGSKPIADRRGRHMPSENQGSETGEISPPDHEDDKGNQGQTVPKQDSTSPAK